MHPPDGYDELAEACLTSARNGQAGTSVDGLADFVDHWRMAPLLLTKAEAAELLRLSERTLQRLISAGELPAVHVGGAARIRREDLEGYVASLGCQPLAGRIETKVAGPEAAA